MVVEIVLVALIVKRPNATRKTKIGKVTKLD